MRPKLDQRSAPARLDMMLMLALVGAGFFYLAPDIAQASVDGSLRAIRSKLTGVILPVLAVISIAWAGFSLMTGNERAKTHVWYAIFGSAIAFGAQSLVEFIQQTVR